MSWTDERIETLKKLWSEGKSASEIADVLGDVTRNAVIGKAHRLGLSGRPSPIKKVKVGSANTNTTKSKTTPKVKEPAKKAVKKTGTTVSAKEDKKSSVVTDIKSRFSLFKNKKAAVEKNEPVEEMPSVSLPEGVKIPKVDKDKLINLLDLTEKMCRWPIGDPKDDDFGFCGEPVHEGHLYCPAHVVMAYQVSTKKSDEKAKAEKRRKMEAAAKAAMEDDEDDDIDLDEEIDIDALENVDDVDDDMDDDDL